MDDVVHGVALGRIGFRHTCGKEHDQTKGHHDENDNDDTHVDPARCIHVERLDLTVFPESNVIRDQVFHLSSHALRSFRDQVVIAV